MADARKIIAAMPMMQHYEPTHQHDWQAAAQSLI
jgi:hypothetical protein